MSCPQENLDTTEQPVSGNETVESITSSADSTEQDTRERPWKGFWPPPPSGKFGYAYEVAPGNNVVIAGN
ncbi:hypothetical protein N7465_007361 [Penicillium sp. CMV-2018d]|nr:hypothetical protein N7465_007361 [Penicillium sp. CMV-2018d]